MRWSLPRDARSTRRFALTAAATALAAVPWVASAVGPAPHYPTTALTSSSESNMCGYDSANATCTPPSGLVRDRSVIRYTDGCCYIVHARHFTALREDSGDNDAVPTGNRFLRAVSSPDRSVRHRDNLAHAEPVSSSSSATARQDATFCGRAGLAGGTSTSFESCSHPGRYPRHHNFGVRVDWRTSEATFARDASFTLSTPLA